MEHLFSVLSRRITFRAPGRLGAVNRTDEDEDSKRLSSAVLEAQQEGDLVFNS